jgi:hypothetical protein
MTFAGFHLDHFIRSFQHVGRNPAILDFGFSIFDCRITECDAIRAQSTVYRNV